MIPFSPQIIGTLGLALLLSLGWGGCQASKVKTAETARRTAENERTAALAAITSKDVVIRQMEGRLTQWQRLAESEAARAIAAANRAETEAATRREAQAALRERERQDDALPDCDMLLETDLATVCPSRAFGLRVRAADGLRRPAGGDPGAIPAGDRSTPDR